MKGYTVTVEDINRRSISSKNRDTIAEKVRDLHLSESVKKGNLIRAATVAGKSDNSRSHDHDFEGQCSPRDESRKNFI